MLTDRVMRIFLGAIAVLLAAVLIQALLKSPAEADPGYSAPGSSKVYDVRLVSIIPGDPSAPIKAVVPLVTLPEREASAFAIQSEKGVVIYRLDYYEKTATQ